MFSISVLSNTNVYLLIQNKKIISVNSLLRTSCLTSALIGGAFVVYPFFLSLSLALMCFNRLNYCFYNSLCVFLSLFLSKWCYRRIVCLHLAYRKVRNNILKRITFCDIFLTKSEFVVFFHAVLVWCRRTAFCSVRLFVQSDKNRRACFVVSRFLRNFVSIYNKV